MVGAQTNGGFYERTKQHHRETVLGQHLLDISYTKKDGTVVSLEDIRAMKTRSQEAYAEAVSKNAKAMASAGV